MTKSLPIRSTSYDQTEILKSILKLHVPSGVIDCDPTYSKGSFYTKGKVKRPKFCFDIYPRGPDVQQADCRNLPFSDSSLQSIIFDPSFLATSGGSLLSEQGNIINRRFGVYPNEKALHQMYIDSLREFYRILKPKGILIFKCQDKVCSDKQYMSHVFVATEAEKIGYYPKDLFILLAKNRLVANWQMDKQQNARKYHCYFWVFQKDGKQVQYI